MIRSIVHRIKIVILVILDLLFRYKKHIEFILSGKHEFQRICDIPCDIYEKTMRIDRWLKRTNCRQIKHYIQANPVLKKQINKIIKSLKEAVHHTSASPINRKVKLKFNSPHVGRVENVESIDIELGSLMKDLTRGFIKTIKKVKQCKLTLECENNLSDILYRILCYNITLLLAEEIASIKYDSDIDLHSDKLLGLWNNLIRADESSGGSRVFPVEFQERVTSKNLIVSNRWSHIGFQGEDPGTDFRGMGLLGLLQLEYLSRRPRSLARDLLQRSLDESHNYPFAIVGINITYNLLNLIRDGSMKHFYYDTGDVLFRNKQRNLNLVRTLNDIYVELFLRFDCFWHDSKPENIFAFRELMEKFVNIVQIDLANRNFSLKFSY